jgi:Mg-chelatase subunit ChlD
MRLTAWIWAAALPLSAANAVMPAQPTPSTMPDEQPGTVALVIDTSGSVHGPELARAQQIAAGILQSLPKGSEIAVFGFDDQSRLVLPRTSSGDDVRRAIQGLRSAGRYTALYDALYDASRYLRDAPGARKAIVLMTDGKDENSALNLEDGLRIAEQSGLPVFAVGVGRVEERVLRRIAKITGGSFFRAEGVSGGEIASAILEVVPQAAATPAASAPEAPAAEAHPAAPVRASSPPAPVAPARPLARWWPWAAVAAVLLATGAGLATRRRRAASEAGVEVPPAGDDTLKPQPEARTTELPHLQPSTSASGEIESPTLVMRAPEDEEAGHTLVLRAWSVLAVLEGPAAGQAFELSHDSGTSIGRGLNNDVVLDDPAVSSQHCRIRPEPEGFVMHDLNSTNGTFVNDRRVTRHLLAEGDQIRIGESLLQYRTDQRRG